MFFNEVWSVGLVFFKVVKVSEGNDSAQEGSAFLIRLKCASFWVWLAGSGMKEDDVLMIIFFRDKGGVSLEWRACLIS